jgi:hypothetical protein
MMGRDQGCPAAEVKQADLLFDIIIEKFSSERAAGIVYIQSDIDSLCRFFYIR